MALHFNCGQYENAFDSKKLQNWEMKHKYRKRPGTKGGFTQIIANDRGHLLPSLPRASRSPWGTFVGTWDLPKKLPGNKQTDPTARSAEAHFRYTGAKAEADVVIYGRSKMRRAKAGQPLQAMPAHCQATELTEDTQKVPSVRSGAANPIVKGTPQRGTPVNQISPQDCWQTQPDMGGAFGSQAPEMINPELIYSSPNAMRLSQTHLGVVASNHTMPRTPYHGSPLPPLPGSPAGRMASPQQVLTPKPTTPYRVGSAQRLSMSPVM